MTEKYLAIAFFQDLGTQQSVTFSRPTDSTDAEEIAEFLCEQSSMDMECLTTILLLESNGSQGHLTHPLVKELWLAGEDFNSEDDAEYESGTWTILDGTDEDDEEQ